MVVGGRLRIIDGGEVEEDTDRPQRPPVTLFAGVNGSRVPGGMEEKRLTIKTRWANGACD